MKEGPLPESTAVTRLAAASEPPEDPAERAVFFLNRANFHARRAVEDAWQCGIALNETKDSLPHGAWLPWLESEDIPKRTATRFMQLARGIKIGHLGRYDSVDAALKSVDKRKIDESTKGAREALRQDLEQLRGSEPMPAVPSDPVGENETGNDRTADVVALRQNAVDKPEDEARTLKAELIGAHEHIDDLKEQLALVSKIRGEDGKFEWALVTVGKLQDKLRSTAASLRECSEHGQVVKQENQRLRKRLRDLDEHIRP